MIEESDTYKGKVIFVDSQWELAGGTYDDNGQIINAEFLKMSNYHEYSWGVGIHRYNGDFQAITNYSEFEVIGNIYSNPELVKQ